MAFSKTAKGLLGSTFLGSALALTALSGYTQSEPFTNAQKESLLQFYNTMQLVCKNYVDPVKACDLQRNLNNAIHGMLEGVNPAPVKAPAKTPVETVVKKDMEPKDQLQKFYEATQTLCATNADRAKACDLKTNVENAINGVLHGLDPHSGYMNAEELTAFETGAEVSYGGIGAPLGTDPDKKLVVPEDPAEETPAARAGLKAGDMLLKINDTSVAGMTAEQAVKLIRGKIDTTVVLTVSAKDGAPRSLSIVRKEIETPAVTAAVIDNIGYLKIASFYKKDDKNPQKDVLTSAFVKAVNGLNRQTGNKVSSWILDLRGNPGGMVGPSVNIAGSLLTENKPIVSMRGRPGSKGETLSMDSAVPLDLLDGKELAVLVDGGSASASEIVAGALQDYKRATVFGTTPTFGKGSVQVMRRHWEGAIKLTIQKYYTPVGRSIQDNGIKPDIQVVDPNARVYGVREADLQNALAHPESTADTTRTVATCAAKGSFDTVALPKNLLSRNGKPDIALLCAREFLNKTPQLVNIQPVAATPGV